MKITFLGQGLESESKNAVGHYLIKYLKSSSFHSFVAISAFASQAAIVGLSDTIEEAKKAFKQLTIIVGIDQEGTSKETLEEILKLNVDSYIFYQTESPIFHPKIYLFEGDNDVKIILGSNNLTGSGLFTNVEGAFLVEFTSGDVENDSLLTEFKNYYKSLLNFSDPNLFKIEDSIINDFVLKGIVPDEATRKTRYAKKSENNIATESTSLSIPKRKVATLPYIFKKKKTIQDFSNSAINSEIFITDEELLWDSGPLTERDLNIPTGSTTNATGSILLKKGKLKEIDQRHHFRDVIFGSLPWVNDTNASTSHLQRTTAFFAIFIGGISQGVFPLLLTHNTKTDSKSYKQKNSMTSLSWGDAKSIIAKRELIGKSIKLYGHLQDIYIMHID